MEDRIEQPIQQEAMSVQDWLITLLIAAIPVINIIMFFVWAFGDNANPNKQNWAKATLLWLLILAALNFFFFVIIGVSFFASGY